MDRMIIIRVCTALSFVDAVLISGHVLDVHVHVFVFFLFFKGDKGNNLKKTRKVRNENNKMTVVESLCNQVQNVPCICILGTRLTNQEGSLSQLRRYVLFLFHLCVITDMRRSGFGSLSEILADSQRFPRWSQLKDQKGAEEPRRGSSAGQVS